MDPGELYQFEQANELSKELLKKWLSEYKFKNWEVTETRQLPVTSGMKEQRAGEIADKLSDIDRWHSHGIGINMRTLQEELNLRIEDLGKTPALHELVKEYWDLLRDYLAREKWIYFVHTKESF